MANNTTHLSMLLEKVEVYIKINIELLKLKAIKLAASTISSIASSIVLILIIVLSATTINIGLALWIGKLFGDSFYGFFILGAFYALLAILLYLFRKRLIQYPISNSIIKQMLKKN